MQAGNQNEQRTGVKLGRAEALHEGRKLDVLSLATDLVMDLVTYLAPAFHRAFKAELLHSPDGPVESH
jgi:hypothetical protein